MTAGTLLSNINRIILEPLALFLFAVAFVVFIWGIVEFIRDSEGESGREKGKKNIIWGIIGMVIMISVYGIINIVAGAIGAQGDLPQQNSGQYLLNPKSVTDSLE